MKLITTSLLVATSLAWVGPATAQQPNEQQVLEKKLRSENRKLQREVQEMKAKLRVIEYCHQVDPKKTVPNLAPYSRRANAARSLFPSHARYSSTRRAMSPLKLVQLLSCNASAARRYA